MIQQDSIAHETIAVQGDSAVPQHKPLTPAMVISWLPRNATPAQQDSAIQSRFKASEIRWSQRPDTLHLPGHDKGHNMLDVQLPQYYKEGFFSKDTLFHPELPGGRYGVAGDPVPYTIHNDNIITSLLLVCFVLTLISLSNTSHFIISQAKKFFYTPHEESTEVAETANEMRFLVSLIILDSIMIALLYYFYSLHTYGDTYVLKSQYYLIVIYLAMTVAYFILRFLTYSIVNTVFFGSKKSGQFAKALLFISSLEATMLFPLVVLSVYFELSIKNAIIYFTTVLVIVKILTIYKCFTIFFRQKVFKLQIILYFCSLEIVPLLAFWGVLETTANSLKINF